MHKRHKTTTGLPCQPQSTVNCFDVYASTSSTIPSTSTMSTATTATAQHTLSKALIVALQSLLNGWDFVSRTHSKSELEAKHKDFISTFRTEGVIFRKQQGAVKAPQKDLLIHTHKMENVCYANAKLRTTPLVPTIKTKARYIDLDNSTILGLFREVCGEEKYREKKNCPERICGRWFSTFKRSAKLRMGNRGNFANSSALTEWVQAQSFSNTFWNTTTTTTMEYRKEKKKVGKITFVAG